MFSAIRLIYRAIWGLRRGLPLVHNYTRVELGLGLRNMPVFFVQYVRDRVDELSALQEQNIK